MKNKEMYDFEFDENQGNDTFYKDVFELASVGKSIIMPSGKVLVNQTFADMLGYQVEELQGLRWQDITPKEDISNTTEQIKPLLIGTADSAKFFKRYIHKSGHIVWTEVSVAVKRDAYKEPLYYIATIVDVTAQKKIEEKGRLLTVEHDLILQNMLNAFIILDSVFDKKGKYISFRFGFFNDAYAKSSGLQLDDVIGKDVFEVWPETEPEWVKVYGEVAVTGIPKSFDMYHKHTQSWYHCNAYRPSDSPARVCVISEDITQRKNQEQKIAAMNRGILILKETAERLTAAQAGDDIYAEIAAKLIELTMGVSATLGLYDEKDKSIHVKHIEIERNFAGYLFDILGGRKLTEVSFPVTDKMYKNITDKQFSYVSTLYEATFGVISKLSGKVVKKLQGIDRYLGIAYFLDGELYGTSLVALSGDVPDTPEEILSSFMQIVSVTLRRFRAEQTLREKEQELRLITDNISDSVWLADLQLHTTWISPSIVRSRGFSLEELAEFNLNKHMTPQSESRIKQLASELMTPQKLADPQANIQASVEIEYYRKDGRTYCVDTVATLIRDANGTPKAILGVGRDITERKAAKMALQRQASRLQTLHELDRAILEANESAELLAQRALSYLQEILSCPAASLGILDNTKQEIMIVAAEGRDNKGIHAGIKYSVAALGDIESLRFDEKKVYTDLKAKKDLPELVNELKLAGFDTCLVIPLVCSDALIGCLCLAWKSRQDFTSEEIEIALEISGQIALAIEQARLRDETERYASEMEMRVKDRTAQLEALNNDLEAFAYSVSHDLRAPLRIIDGYIDVLLEDYAGYLDSEGNKVCTVIKSGARKMSSLIDDLLAFSRIGRSDIQRSSVNMQELVQGVCKEIVPPSIESRIELGFGNLPDASCDPNLIQQVWVNLIGNAVKFSSKKEKPVIRIWGEDEGNLVVYSISDNGAGFDMEMYDKLFAAFQRLHSPDDFDGTGIGLAIVQRIIERHNGRVWAEGTPGKGATFSFSINKEIPNGS
jgi:PAS domain S-box-containing protein